MCNETVDGPEAKMGCGIKRKEVSETKSGDPVIGYMQCEREENALKTTPSFLSFTKHDAAILLTIEGTDIYI